MTKTVFNNRMVAHVWAQQTQESGKSHNGNFHFQGDTIYSYRTPLARFIKTLQGETVVLLDTCRYSVTTSGKHWPAINRALPSGLTQYDVPSVSNVRGNGPDHTKNLSALAAAYTAAVAGFMKARHVASLCAYPAAVAGFMKARHVDSGELMRLDMLADCARSYARSFGLEYAAPNVDADIGAIRAHRAAIDARRAKRQSQPAYINREWHKLVAQAESANAAWDRSVARRAEYRAKLARWLAGENVELPYGWDAENGDTLLRVYGEEIQTTQGASFPVEHGRKAFAMVLACRNAGSTWHRNGHAIHLGHFQIDAIDAQGNVKAGCHTVKWPAIETVARQIGLITS